MTYFDYFKNHRNANTAHCKPYESEDGAFIAIVQDGVIDTIVAPSYEGQKSDGSLNDKLLNRFAQDVNQNYDYFKSKGCTDTEIILKVMHETGCWYCAFKSMCDTMHEEM